MEHLQIRVPGSTSNLGPGFDLVGLALDLHLEVRSPGPAPGADHVLVDRGPVPGPAAPANLIVRAFDRAAGPSRGRRGRVFEVSSEIPIARGFGSSGAAIVAGLLLGRAHAGRASSEAELLELAVELEGHPDNAAASLLGGCTLWVGADTHPPRVLHQRLHPELAFAIAWPPEPLETRRAREVLPSSVSLTEAVAGAGRLIALLRGLETGDHELLRRAADERLHVPHRLPLIRGAAEALRAAAAAGASLATLSGSGSGLFAIAPEGRAADVAQAMAAAFRAAQGAGEGRVVAAVLEPPRVR